MARVVRRAEVGRTEVRAAVPRAFSWPDGRTTANEADLSGILTDGTPQPDPPAFCRCQEGHARFYAVRVIGLYGDPESAKSWIAEVGVVETFAAGGRAIIDVDHNGPAALQELHHTAGAVARLGTIVAGLDQGDVVWGRTRVKTGGDDAGTTYEAATNAWVLEWQKERRHLVAVAAACAKAGIEERRQALAESQRQLLARVVQVVLAGLDLSPEQQQRVTVVVPAAFREIAAGGTT